MQPATLKFYVHHAVVKCENGTDVIVKGAWHNMPTKQSWYSCAPDCLYAVSILACKIARNLTPTSICAGTKSNNMQRRKIGTGVTFGRDRSPLKLPCCRECKGSPHLRIFLTPRLTTSVLEETLKSYAIRVYPITSKKRPWRLIPIQNFQPAMYMGQSSLVKC